MKEKDGWTELRECVPTSRIVNGVRVVSGQQVHPLVKTIRDVVSPFGLKFGIFRYEGMETYVHFCEVYKPKFGFLRAEKIGFHATIPQSCYHNTIWAKQEHVELATKIAKILDKYSKEEHGTNPNYDVEVKK